MSAPILSPSFVWLGSATHSTSDAFAARQRQRMAEAAKARKANNVRAIRKERDAKEAANRG